jgi:hypothetical protein
MLLNVPRKGWEIVTALADRDGDGETTMALKVAPQDSPVIQ